MSRHAATRERPRRDEITPARPARPPRRRVRRLTKWLVAVGVVATAGVFGAQWLLHQSDFRVQHVTITGNRHESAAAILGRSGLIDHPSMIALNESKIVKRTRDVHVGPQRVRDQEVAEHGDSGRS